MTNQGEPRILFEKGEHLANIESPITILEATRLVGNWSTMRGLLKNATKKIVDNPLRHITTTDMGTVLCVSSNPPAKFYLTGRKQKVEQHLKELRTKPA